MSLAAVGLLALLAVAGAANARRPAPRAAPEARARALATAVTPVVVLLLAAGLASRAAAVTEEAATLAVVAGVCCAALAGGPLATAVLLLADPRSQLAPPAPSAAGAPAPVRGPGDPEVLRGGAWIGALERLAVSATLLAGWPEGVALVLAVKGLGRYPELRAPVAAERFIIGTFVSVLWAAGCAGVVALLPR